MAIYQLFEEDKQEQPSPLAPEPEPPIQRTSFFSAFVTRLSFAFLLGADFLWLLYALGQVFCVGFFHCLLLGKNAKLTRALSRTYLSLRRALICAISLLIGLFSPSFGMMIACSYFVMYDKAGIDEVIPSSLQAQFRDLFPL